MLIQKEKMDLIGIAGCYEVCIEKKNSRLESQITCAFGAIRSKSQEPSSFIIKIKLYL